MRRARRLALAPRPAIGLAIGMTVGPLLALGPASLAAATLEVEVEGAEPGGAPVYVALCQGGLSERECNDGQRLGGGGRRRAMFEDVAPGSYAVAAYQDLNGSGRLERTQLGLPLEPYGFSGETGPGRPTFARAAFALREPGAAIRVRLGRALPSRR